MTGHRRRWIVRKNRASRRHPPWSLMSPLELWHKCRGPRRPNFVWLDVDEIRRRYNC